MPSGAGGGSDLVLKKVTLEGAGQDYGGSRMSPICLRAALPGLPSNRKSPLPLGICTLTVVFQFV